MLGAPRWAVPRGSHRPYCAKLRLSASPRTSRVEHVVEGRCRTAEWEGLWRGLAPCSGKGRPVPRGSGNAVVGASALRPGRRGRRRVPRTARDRGHDGTPWPKRDQRAVYEVCSALVRFRAELRCRCAPPTRRLKSISADNLFVYIPRIWVVPAGMGARGLLSHPSRWGLAREAAGRRQATKLGARNGHIGERPQHPRQTAAGRARRDTAEPGGSREPEGSLPAVRRRTRVLVSGRESDRTYGSSRAQIAAAGRNARP
jgi:hypothetical protein